MFMSYCHISFIWCLPLETAEHQIDKLLFIELKDCMHIWSSYHQFTTVITTVNFVLCTPYCTSIKRLVSTFNMMHEASIEAQKLAACDMVCACDAIFFTNQRYWAITLHIVLFGIHVFCIQSQILHFIFVTFDIFYTLYQNIKNVHKKTSSLTA